MSVAVYANGMSIACKVASGKTIAAFPDVCLSPPAPPIPPIPYPNTSAASDTSDGSKTVQIGGDEAMLKNKSTFKTSTGNEAATKSFGMGVVTHQITGKAAFVAWSMDVKFEGENIPRNMDLMGQNEGSDPPNILHPYTDGVASGSEPEPEKCPPHVWKEEKSETPEQTKEKNNKNATTLLSKPSKALQAKGPLFENHAIDSNMEKMNIQATSVVYRCSRAGCGAEQEVDIKGEKQIAEAKSRTAKGWKSKGEQCRNYREIQSQLFGASTPPLAKMDKSMPDVAESQAKLLERGHQVELL